MPDDRPAGAPFDCDALSRLRRFGGQKLLTELIELFVSDVPNRLSAAREAVSRGDGEGYGRAMHSIRSSAAQFGLVRLAGLCTEGERLAADSDRAALASHLAAIEVEVPAGIEWMRHVDREADT